MFCSCELYYCDGLYIDQEMAQSLALQKTNNISFLSILGNYDTILSFKNGNIEKADKAKLIKKVQDQILDDKEICYLIRDKALIVPDVLIYYGISINNNIIALYDKKSIRDAKLTFVKRYDAGKLVDDMADSNVIINAYDAQKKLQKIYNGLKG